MKLLLRLFGVLLIAVLLGLGALFFLPGERIAQIAAERISAMTGREVSMSGTTSISFYPVLGISTGKTTIATADWATAGPLLSADSLKVGVDPLALLRGEIRITGLEIARPRIVIERDRNGQANWQIGVDGVSSSGQGAAAQGSPAGHSRALALTLDRALISDASVLYIDGQTGTRREISQVNVDLRWPSHDGKASFDASLRPATQDLRITGQIDHFGPFISEGAVSPLKATLSTGGGTLSLEGRAGTAPQLSAAVSADIADTARFLGALGLAATELPEGLGRTLKARAQLDLTRDIRLSLRDMLLDLGGNNLTGALDVVTTGARPHITAQLEAGALDLTGLTGGKDGASGTAGGAAAEGWSKTLIDASALGLADADIALSASSLDLGQFQFGRADIRLGIDAARAVAQLKQLEGYGGSITGQLVANNRSGLSVGGDLNAQGIDMERLLRDAAGITRFATTGAARLNFLGVGQSVDAIMHSLSGNLSLATGRGVISGFDLDRLMRSGDGSGGTTVFDSLTASFVIKDGDMRGNDLHMTLPRASASGAGRIGIGARDIDYLFTPVLLQGENSRGLAIPVHIRGPWSGPAIRPDLEKALELNLREEREKLEEKARDKLNRKIDKFVEKELGISPGKSGESDETDRRDDIKEKAVKELFRLFK